MSRYQNYIPQPLAFYRELTADDRRYQTRNLPQCSGSNASSLWELTIVADIDDPQLRLPRFDLKMNYESTGVTDFYLRSTDGVTNVSLNTSFFSVNSLGVNPADETEYFAIVFDGTPITMALDSIPDKTFYLTVTDGTNTWYSETFVFADESADNTLFPATCDGGTVWVKMSYSNTGCIISNTIYNDGPSFGVFLPVNLTRPKYEYNPDQEDDGDGGQSTYFQRLEKRWEFYIVGPEYLADALTAVQMFSSVSLTFEGGDSIICNDVRVEPEWINDCDAKITFSFIADFLTKTACC